jgi:hypothetical protein
MALEPQQDSNDDRLNIRAAAQEAVATGLRRYGPEAVGMVLIGVAAVLVAVLSVVLLDAPPLLGIGAGGVTAGAALWKEFRPTKPPRLLP